MRMLTEYTTNNMLLSAILRHFLPLNRSLFSRIIKRKRSDKTSIDQHIWRRLNSRVWSNVVWFVSNMLSFFCQDFLFLYTLATITYWCRLLDVSAAVLNNFWSCWNLIPIIMVKRSLKLIWAWRNFFNGYIFVTLVSHILSYCEFIQDLASILRGIIV